MPNTRFNFKTPSHIRFFTSLLIFALASAPLSYAQQPQPRRPAPQPQPRILVEETPKANTAKTSGPRGARPELVLQTGVAQPAFHAAFSPDGRLLASMDFLAGSIKLWEVSTGREVFVINLGARNLNTSAVNSSFVFSPDGSSLFSVSAGTIKQWDTRAGRLIRSADLNQGKDFGLAYFSADARLLATTPESKSSLAVWDVKSGRKLQELKLNVTLLQDQLQDVQAIFQKSQKIISEGKIEESNPVKPITFNDEQFLTFAISPDGRTLATYTGVQNNGFINDGGERFETLTLRDASSGRVIRTIKIPALKKATKPAMSGAFPTPEELAAAAAAMANPTLTNYVRAIRFTPDGRVAVAFNDTSLALSGTGMRATGRENKIRIWDASSGRELISLLDIGALNSKPVPKLSHFGAPLHFAFSSDNRQCAVTSGATVRLLDPVAGRNLGTIIGHNDEVIAVSFSADGKLLATTSLDNTIKIWDVSAAATTGRAKLERVLGGAALPLENAAFSGDGRALTVSGANTIGVWELNTGAARRTITLPAVTRGMINDDPVRASRSVFSADGRLIAAQSGDGEVKLWETRSGRELKSFRLSPGKQFVGGAISPDGRRAALVEDGSDLNSISGATGQLGIPPSAAQPNAAQYAQGSSQIQSQMNKPQTGIEGIDLSQLQKMSGEQLMALIQKMGAEQWQALTEKMSGEQLMAVSQKMSEYWQKDLERSIKENEETMKALKSGNLGKVTELLEANAAPAAPGDESLSVRLWDANAAGKPLSLQNQKKSGYANTSPVAFNNDGKLLASAGGGRSIKIIEALSGRELLKLTQERSAHVDSLAWSADGRLLASSQIEARAGVDLTRIEIENYASFLDHPIILWDAVAGRELRKMSGHKSNIRATAFSPDGRLLASGGDDTMVKLWETATGRELATLKGHSQSVKAVAFSSDGKLLVSGGEDGSARLWDVKSGEAMATLALLNGGADWLVVTPDGLFDGTPGAWSQILWRFSPNDIFDVAPVEIFFNDFFYPGLLSDIASGKRPRAAQDVSQKDRRQPILNLSRADGQSAAGRAIKVKIEINEPASAGQATPVGARDVRLFRNGTLVKFWRGDALKGQKQATLEAEVTTIAGENRLVAYAFNRDGVKSSDDALTVTGDAALRRKGVAYVIACGVNQYANTQYNLKYAVADATSFAEEIRAQQTKLQEYERVEVIPLLDREATKANILLALKRLSNAQAALPAGAPPALSKIQAAQPEDAVLIFFAGHGAAQGARFYLIPHDLGYAGARNALTAEAVRTILSRSVSDLELEAALEGVDAGRLLFVLDACNSGQALEAEEKRRGPMNSSGLAQLAYEKGMYILTAAQSYQAALEAAELGHGYLTFALIEDGLKRGLADRDPKDGLALAREWFNYAEERVPQMQEREMQTRLLLNFAVNNAKAKDPKQRNIQRPRAFYRRELETRPFVVAKP